MSVSGVTLLRYSVPQRGLLQAFLGTASWHAEEEGAWRGSSVLVWTLLHVPFSLWVPPPHAFNRVRCSRARPPGSSWARW